MRRASSEEGPVLLAHSYFLQYDPKQVHKMKPYAPLGTLISAAVAGELGYEVHLFDAMLASGVEDFLAALGASRPRVVAILEDNFNFLTKMCTTRMRQACLEMVRAARAQGCRVAVNGADAADHPELYLAAGADAVIVGEPEAALADLLALWTNRVDQPLDRIPGLVLAELDGIGTPRLRRTGLRPPAADLDALPYPAWNLVDVARYRRTWVAAHGRLSWNMATSRGCPYHCNWCAKPIFGTRYTQRSPANAADELARLREVVAADHVWFADDIFGLTPRWIEAFAREVTARNARTPFTMQSRVNLMRPPVVEALARSAAEEVWLGVESGSQTVLDAMDKRAQLEDVRLATRTLRANGIRACWFIQLGYPGETWEDVLRTRDLIRAERPDEIGVSVSYPLPGTPFYDRVRSQIGPKTNWTDSDDLDMLFAGTYARPFYRKVRDLLHGETSPPAPATAPVDWDGRWAELAAEAADAWEQSRTRLAS